MANKIVQEKVIFVVAEQRFSANFGTVDMGRNDIQTKKVVFAKDVACQLGIWDPIRPRKS